MGVFSIHPFFENLHDLVWRKLALFHSQLKIILVLNCPIFGDAYKKTGRSPLDLVAMLKNFAVSNKIKYTF